MKIALRVDVDTWRGTKVGVPQLCRIFKKHNITASFFFSVGPDNMGRHLWRLLKPAFLWKMLRSNAAGLYGPEIILMGTMWPGPRIGRRLAPLIKVAAEDGHEIGFHAWDHHREQSKIEQLTASEVEDIIRRGCEILQEITGTRPVASAVPGWRCTDQVLQVKEKFHFRYNSDCRGDTVFMPTVDDKLLATPQIPVTLPTYDEVIGRNGINDSNYNDYMLKLLLPDGLNVLTIHAEAEGGRCSGMFEQFIMRATERGYSFVPLGELLENSQITQQDKIEPKSFPGREGWLACQATFQPSFNI